MKNAGKFIIIIGLIGLVAFGAIKAKQYYNDRYVFDQSYYTQIPADTVNEDSKLYSDSGEAFDDGKSYDLVGYNEDGEKREVHFIKRGKAEDYYAPSTYMKVDMSKDIVIGESVIDESEVPQKALEAIKSKGTKK